MRMFGQSNWKHEVLHQLSNFEQEISELKKGQMELKSQNQRMLRTLKTVAKKVVLRLPLSLESLDKGLGYDLIFSEELESWRSVASSGVIVDLRAAVDCAQGCITGSVNIPFESLESRVDGIARDIPLLLVCDNGVKSVSACELLSQKGFQFLYVLKGGMSHYEGPTEVRELLNPQVEKVQARQATT